MPNSLPAADTFGVDPRQTPAAPTYASKTDGAVPGEVIVVVNVPTLDNTAVALDARNLVKSIVLFWSETAFPVGTIDDYFNLDQSIYFRRNTVVAAGTVTFDITGTTPGATLYLEAGAIN